MISLHIDNAMKWGFGWQQGPFEIWDAIGVEKSVDEDEGRRRESACFRSKFARQRL